MKISNVTKRVNSQFVAGVNLNSALDIISDLHSKGFQTSLNYLGESVESIQMARLAAQEYSNGLSEISRLNLNSTVSVKLTQLGIDLDEDLCYDLMVNLLEKAKQHNTLIRIDLENTPYTDKTIDLYWRLRDNYDNIGLVLQSYLYRTENDLNFLIMKGGSVRIVKGAYSESDANAMVEKKSVSENYIKLLDMVMSSELINTKLFLAIATHDKQIINKTISLADDKGLKKGQFEFQMMYGIREDLQKDTLNKGFPVRVYVPYGSSWYPFLIRRLAERPANLFLFLKCLM